MALRHPGDVALCSAAAPHGRSSRSLFRSPSRLPLSISFISTQRTSRIQMLPPSSAAAKDYDSLSSTIAGLKLDQEEEEEEREQEQEQGEEQGEEDVA
ncbi:hypothetical protein ACMD2_11497 [Ananas comosus]|uniref:Uncharacterized protein n=1 Tax=Ananas comosus TaxID=4615 RepID=A0A199V1S9_ANACO|nr:hypothetical protein ACMD2_11497 [Ananas comosus]